MTGRSHSSINLNMKAILVNFDNGCDEKVKVSGCRLEYRIEYRYFSKLNHMKFYGCKINFIVHSI